MLDINYLKADYVYNEKYCVRQTEKVYSLSRQQYDELLNRIFQGIRSLKKVVDLTGIKKESSVNRNADFVKQGEIYNMLLKICNGDISNILHRLKKDEFAKMDLDRNCYSYKYKEYGKVVYIFDHFEELPDGSGQHFYVKFNFANDEGEDSTIYLTSVHIPKYPIIKIPPLN